MTQGTILELSPLTDNGSSGSFEYLHGTKPLNIYISGSLGNGALGKGTLTLEALAPDGTYVPVKSITINGTGMYTLNTFAFVGRFTLAGATAPATNIAVQGAVKLVI